MGLFGKCGGGGRRSSDRKAAPMLVLITTLSRTHEAALVDLSPTGVRLRGEDLPEHGEDLILVLDRVKCFGTVAWKHEGHCGIAFDGPLPSAEFHSLRCQAAKRDGYTPEMRAAFEDWNQGTVR